MTSTDRNTTSCHLSVMPDEVVQSIARCHPTIVVDGTYGGGGHTRRLLEIVPADGLVIGLDRDPAVLARADSQPMPARAELFLASYEHTDRALAACNVEAADAMVLDLGLSSDQLADRSRGFSFQHDGPLDLRFDPENGIPASEWLARKTETEIADSIYAFGEERYSRRIARAIVEAAKQRNPVKTVAALVSICQRCVPRGKHHDIHPATRTFQALRIAVNDELGGLTRTLDKAPRWLRPGGHLVVISFHSLEDRIVKHAFRDDERWEPLTKKPMLPTAEEVNVNSRARSAKLRVAKRV